MLQKHSLWPYHLRNQTITPWISKFMSLSAVNSNIPTEGCSVINRDIPSSGKPFCKTVLIKNVFLRCVPILFLEKAASCYSILLLTNVSLNRVAGACIVLNLFSECLRAYLNCRQSHQNDPNRSKSGYHLFLKVIEWIPPTNFALLFGTTGNLLLHEAGHVVAASAVYNNLESQITITGLFRAATSWTRIGTTFFGDLMGELNARLFVCVAGSLTATFIASIALVASVYYKDRFPELSKYVILSALVTIAYQILYALSALVASQSDLGHDFVMMWQVGVHPILSSLILASIPVIALAIYFRLRTKSPNKV